MSKELPFRFEPESHRYYLGDVELPGTTRTIADVVGVGWQADQWFLDRGSKVHAAAKLLVEERLDWASVDPQIEGRVRGIKRFLDDFPMSAVQAEHQLVSRRYRYAGTLDLWGKRGGKTVLCDFKGTIDPRVDFQLGSYSLLLLENHQEIVSEAYAVELFDDAHYKLRIGVRGYSRKAHFDLNEAEKSWLAVLQVRGAMARRNLLPKQKQKET